MLALLPEALQSQTIANLRAQYAEARKRQAELQSELGPRHPALRQMEQQVQDLRRAINEEVERFAQSAKNDLIRARDFEASLNKALETQKRQSVQMSQASVRLRELEREVEASRDVYQSFLKRSRETEEQETLNTSSARVIGDATVPQRRTFLLAMSLLAMIGFVFGGLAASGWFIAASQLMPGTNPVQPRDKAPAETPQVPAPAPAAAKQPPAALPQPQPVLVSLIEKPPIVRLQEADVMRTLGSILATDSTADVTRLGWPTLRAGFPLMTVLNSLREMRAVLARRAGDENLPVVAVIGSGPDQDRSIAALNIALPQRATAQVLLIDADLKGARAVEQGEPVSQQRAQPFRLAQRRAKAARAIPTADGISILPAIDAADAKACDAIRESDSQARSTGAHDLVILDGPAMPWSRPTANCST